jgi:hypothetical protein
VQTSLVLSLLGRHFSASGKLILLSSYVAMCQPQFLIVRIVECLEYDVAESIPGVMTIGPRRQVKKGLVFMFY